jgi:hypothetical protein
MKENATFHFPYFHCKNVFFTEVKHIFLLMKINPVFIEKNLNIFYLSVNEIIHRLKNY